MNTNSDLTEKQYSKLQRDFNQALLKAKTPQLRAALLSIEEALKSVGIGVR